MNMKSSFCAAFIVPCMAFLLGAPALAHADSFSVSGSVWENGTSGDVPALGSSIYTSTPTATFTVTNSSISSLFDFYSSTDSNLSSFLTTARSGHSSNGHPNGDTLTFLTGSSAANDGINDDVFQFVGTTTLKPGSYAYADDDGMILYLTGNGLTNDAVINAPGPTGAVPNSFCVGGSGCVAAGTYSFVLDYAEVDGAPAELYTTLPLTGPPPSITPEPTSIFLLGTGLLGLAWAVRRRMLV